MKLPFIVNYRVLFRELQLTINSLVPAREITMRRITLVWRANIDPQIERANNVGANTNIAVGILCGSYLLKVLCWAGAHRSRYCALLKVTSKKTIY